MDQRDILKEEQPFSYKITKQGSAFLYFKGKHIKTVSPKLVRKIEAAEARNDSLDVQLVLAKLTGHFKHGNEKGFNKT